MIRAIFTICWDAIDSLVNDGGLANAGNLALSLLLSIFPFMLVVAVMVDIWGEPELLEQVLQLVFSNWPAGTAAPIASQIKVVLGQAGGQIFSFSMVVALTLATNGVESARDGLNRAYKLHETRSFFWRRLQGLVFIVLGALGFILTALILVGTPVVWHFLEERIPLLADFSIVVGFGQYAIAAALLVAVLFFFHYVLPNGHFRFTDLVWGVLLTVIGIVVGSKLFAIYLVTYANYTALYAGLAGIMITIIYLYYMSILILFGAEFNAALADYRGREISTQQVERK